jgi:hypothetical protein
MLLRMANSPDPVIVQTTAGDREPLSRDSTIARPDQGATIWPRITGLGSGCDYPALRDRYKQSHRDDSLFFKMDHAWRAACLHAILESKNTGPPTLMAMARGRSHEERLKGTIYALYRHSCDLYRSNRAGYSGEAIDFTRRTTLSWLVDRAQAVRAAVMALGRNYNEDQAAFQGLIDLLMDELHRALWAAPNAESELIVVPRLDARAVGGDVEMAPSSPTVATRNPGPGFRHALDRRIRSTRDPSRTARRLPNVPSSLVDPNSPRREVDTGVIPSSSPVQVTREDPQQSPQSPLHTRSRQALGRDLFDGESISGGGDLPAQSPPSSPPVDQLPPHQGASPIAPDGSDWPTDNGEDDTESIFGGNATVRPIVESPGEAHRRALSAEYMDRVEVYGEERYNYLLAHPDDEAWDEIIPRRTPPVLRLHPREARLHWEMPVDEDDVEEAVWWEI